MAQEESRRVSVASLNPDASRVSGYISCPWPVGPCKYWTDVEFWVYFKRSIWRGRRTFQEAIPIFTMLILGASREEATMHADKTTEYRSSCPSGGDFLSFGWLPANLWRPNPNLQT